MQTTNKARVMIAVFAVCGLLLSPQAARAAVIHLDLANNASPADPPWATVTISELVSGDIRFVVSLTDSSDLDKGQVGIEQFGFNVDGMVPGDLSLTNLSDGFSYDPGGANMSRFGRFDVGVWGEKGTGLDPLTFTIVANGDSVDTYISALTNKGYLFAAKLSKGAPMAFVATTAVPLPAAAWLFVSGLAGLLLSTRRKQAAKV
jgi:hypothetical protein